MRPLHAASLLLCFALGAPAQDAPVGDAEPRIEVASVANPKAGGAVVFLTPDADRILEDSNRTGFLPNGTKVAVIARVNSQGIPGRFAQISYLDENRNLATGYVFSDTLGPGESEPIRRVSLGR